MATDSGASIYDTETKAASAIPFVGWFVSAMLALLKDPISKTVGPPFQAAEDVQNPDATVYLTLMRVAPPLAFTGFDVNTPDAWDPNKVAHATRFLMVRSGQARVVEGTPQASAYLGQVDAAEPLTDPAYLGHVAAAWRQSKRLEPDPILSRSPDLAKVSLQLLRQAQQSAQGAMSFFANSNNPAMNGAATGPEVRTALQKVRGFAGESGPDTVLGSLFGGDVTPIAPPAPTALPAAPTSPTSGPSGFVMGATLAAVVVAIGGAAWWAHRRQQALQPPSKESPWLG